MDATYTLGSPSYIGLLNISCQIWRKMQIHTRICLRQSLDIIIIVVVIMSVVAAVFVVIVVDL